MEISNKLGPIIAVGVGILATVWLLSGEHGLVQAPKDSASLEKKPAATADQPTKPLFKVSVREQQAQWISQTLRLSGYTVANDTLHISNRLAGYVTDVLVKKGDHVSAGQTLIKIDDRSLQASLIKAQALVNQRLLELEGVQRLTDQKLASKVSVATAEAALASAKAELTELKIDLENSQITAPFSAVINDFSIKSGQWLNTSDPVATLVDVSPMKVAVQLPQRYHSTIQTGTPVEVTIQGLPSQSGRVSYVSRVADSQTRSIPLEITLNDSDSSLSTDISAEVELHLNKVKAHAVSPALLNINDNGQMSIKVLKQGVVEQKTITIIRSDQDKVWITGLADTELLITSGQGFVKAGDKVDAEFNTGVQS